MNRWDKQVHFRHRGWTLVAVVAGSILVAWVTFLGHQVRREPVRCGSLLQPQAARCCAAGQGHSAGKCVGMPASCPPEFVLIKEPRPGCVFAPKRIPIAAGSVTLGPTDWDSADIVKKRTLFVGSFFIDAVEVTQHRYRQCIEADHCAAHPLGDEPGHPVVGVSAAEAISFCQFARGRLPTPAEWLYAAGGSEARRFPWGPHGLVCRRATFGIVTGPCANQGIFADLAGSRPSGATPDGVLDLAGNVAEWTVNKKGQASVRGGSFRAKTAGDLKIWSTRPPDKSDDVGFRCVYGEDVR